MNRLTRAGAIAAGFYVFFPLVAAADTASATTAPDCSSMLSAIKDPSFGSLPPATQAMYKSNLDACLAAGQTALSNQAAQLKSQPTVDALAAIAANKSANTGVMTSGNTLSHIGDWQDQAAFREAGKAIAAAIADDVKARPVILVLGQSSTLGLLGAGRQHDSVVRATLSEQHSNAQDQVTRDGAALKKLTTPRSAPAPAPRGDQSLLMAAPVVGGLLLANGIIGAVEGVAGLFKSSTTVASFTVSSSDAALTVGLSEGLGTNANKIRLANYYITGTVPPIVGLTQQLSADAAQLKSLSAQMQDAATAYTAPDRDGHKATLPDYFVSAQADTTTGIAALGDVLKTLTTMDATTGMAPVDSLGTIERLFDGSPYVLLVSVPQSGGSVITATHVFESDTVSFQSTATVTYLLLEDTGMIASQGFQQIKSFSKESTAGDLAANFAPPPTVQ